MRKFLIASHGQLAGGMKSALELITGATAEVAVLQGYLDDQYVSMADEIANILETAGTGEEWVVFTDLMGGSITNMVLRVAAELGKADSVHIVAGMNLPLVIEVILADPEVPVKELLAEKIGMAREQLVYINEIIRNIND